MIIDTITPTGSCTVDAVDGDEPADTCTAGFVPPDAAAQCLAQVNDTNFTNGRDGTGYYGAGTGGRSGRGCIFRDGVLFGWVKSDIGPGNGGFAGGAGSAP